MKYFPLVWAALRRKPVRGILTLLSVMVAFILFGLTIGINASFQHLTGVARADRIFVNPRFGGQMPESMAQQLAGLPGVTHVAPVAYVGGYYQVPRNNTFVVMVGSDMRAVWPELPLTPLQYGMLKANPAGAFYSRNLARQWKLKPGDVFPIKSPQNLRTDGTQVWPFQVLGIVDDIPTQPGGYAIGNLAYFDQARVAANRYKGVFFRLLVSDPAQGEATAKLIDQHFANSGMATRSITEKNAYDPANTGGGIDIPFLTEAIAGSGLFMILFLTGNSIAQSVRERIPEFAVLKTVGFSDSGVMALVFAEAAIPCLLGAAIGMALAGWIAAIFPRLLPPGVGLPPPYLPPSIFGVAFLCALLVAVFSAVIPATRISRLDVATALSGADVMLKQIIVVSVMNFKALPQRFWASLVIVVGMACVVGVLLSMMAFTTGIVTAYANAGDPGRAIVFSLSAQNEFGSNLPRSTLPVVADAPGVAKDASGKPLVGAEVLIPVPMKRKLNGLDSSMILRGIGPQGIALRPKFRLVEGRLFHPGSRELLVGRAGQGQFAGTNLGDKVILPDGQWPIVGVFTTDRDVVEGDLLGDTDTVMTADRKATYSSVLVRLTSPSAYEIFRRAIITNPALSVSVERHSAYYIRTTAQLAALFNGIAYIVGGILAIGALFGALNTMYAAVSTRTREIATLRALGFGSTPVIISVISEALLLALIGALIGAAIAWIFFDGNQRAIGNNVFVLMVTPGLVLIGISWAMVVGLIGGLFPSIRAVRMPVATAIRAT